jgi:hypothetical protein
MKRLLKSLFCLLTILIFGCTSDENTERLNQLKSRTVLLNAVSDPAISGLVQFTQNTNGTITVDLELINTTEGETHPVHIHHNNALDTGAIALTLNPISGTTGKSTTVVDALDDNTTLSYNQLLNFDGYLNVHQSATNLAVLIAQADIGQNELTGLSKNYALAENETSGITGSIDFFERRNSEILVQLNLEGTTSGLVYPAQLNTGDVVNFGAEVFTFNSVNGIDSETAISQTNLVNLIGQSEAFTYDNLLEYDGHVNVLTDTSLDIVAQANVGSNEETTIPQTITYAVTNNSTTAYVFNGNDLVDAENPNLTFFRGNTYIFNVNTPGQPFYIKTIQGIGSNNNYNDGVTGNGTENGTLQIIVPSDAPNNLYFNSEFEASMTSVITVLD